ncbi:hypothetical protein [Actinomadura rugatobispora]|uniref:Uncharacterized protein n=1 Tax=Actinomadura rugatobispora TaxID=1994 RepID=A0ABW1A4R5_9ACTN|nr:hypothetical protein GCM10010200_038710 [Actinomadura rugatobispora]
MFTDLWHACLDALAWSIAHPMAAATSAVCSAAVVAALLGRQP